MLYCPKCKNEYQDGYTVCTDCKCELVSYEELFPKTAFYFGNPEELKVIEDYMKANAVKSITIEASKDDDTYELFVDEKELKNAQKLLKIYLHDKEMKALKDAVMTQLSEPEQQEMLETGADEVKERKQKLSDMEAIHKMYEPVKIHENAKEKAAEYKSTAFMLIFVGAAGLILDVLMFFDKLPLHFYGASRYLSCGLMGVFFLLFIGFGFSSLKFSRSLAIKGQEEVDLVDKIREWGKENLTAENIDADLKIYEDEDESIKFFRRSEQMKQMILAEFEVEASLLEELIDQLYEEIYSE